MDKEPLMKISGFFIYVRIELHKKSLPEIFPKGFLVWPNPCGFKQGIL
jgi:hypothetical protein